MKIHQAISIGTLITVTLCGTNQASELRSIVRGDAVMADTTTLRSLRVLPEDVSSSLDLSAIPTSKPTAIIIGTYWNCIENEHGIETCDIKLVACTKNQRQCIEL